MKNMKKEHKKQKQQIKNSKRQKTIHRKKTQQKLMKSRINQIYRRSWLLDRLDKREQKEKEVINK